MSVSWLIFISLCLSELRHFDDFEKKRKNETTCHQLEPFHFAKAET